MGFEPPTFRLRVQCSNHCTTVTHPHTHAHTHTNTHTHTHTHPHTHTHTHTHTQEASKLLATQLHHSYLTSWNGIGNESRQLIEHKCAVLKHSVWLNHWLKLCVWGSTFLSGHVFTTQYHLTVYAHFRLSAALSLRPCSSLARRK